MKATEKPHVLLSPLNWGLGHTTRCIPLIEELMALGCQVVVACNSTQRKLLIQEFPHLQFENLEGYDLAYGKGSLSTLLKIIFQIPKNLTIIKRERNWLRDYLRDHKVDAVISDNRFGFQSGQLPCIFLTHQLAIQTGLGRLVDWTARMINYSYINQFNQCWIPDREGTENLAGALSHPSSKPKIPIQYIGAVSRFSYYNEPVIPHSILILLSGPEPQRTLLEKKILEQSHKLNQQLTIVRGLPLSKEIPDMPPHITIHNHLPTKRLNQLICQSEFIICRPGYTSLMDLLPLGKKTILVSTPGQGEQEYLAAYLKSKGMALSIPQHAFSLKQAIDSASRFNYLHYPIDTSQYKEVLRSWVTSLDS